MFEVVWELAGATEVTIRLHGGRGGHSGIDIHRPDNVNALKVMSELDMLIPQGVVKRNERGVVTSINAGLVEGGVAINAIARRPGFPTWYGPPSGRRRKLSSGRFERRSLAWSGNTAAFRKNFGSK
ncbi:MAG: hypothetical protein VCE91_07400 [Nitrospinota bacterium]